MEDEDEFRRPFGMILFAVAYPAHCAGLIAIRRAATVRISGPQCHFVLRSGIRTSRNCLSAASRCGEGGTQNVAMPETDASVDFLFCIRVIRNPWLKNLPADWPGMKTSRTKAGGCCPITHE